MNWEFLFNIIESLRLEKTSKSPSPSLVIKFDQKPLAEIESPCFSWTLQRAAQPWQDEQPRFVPKEISTCSSEPQLAGKLRNDAFPSVNTKRNRISNGILSISIGIIIWRLQTPGHFSSLGVVFVSVISGILRIPVWCWSSRDARWDFSGLVFLAALRSFFKGSKREVLELEDKNLMFKHKSEAQDVPVLVPGRNPLGHFQHRQHSLPPQAWFGALPSLAWLLLPSPKAAIPAAP